jgi:hypothetical protein
MEMQKKYMFSLYIFVYESEFGTDFIVKQGCSDFFISYVKYRGKKLAFEIITAIFLRKEVFFISHNTSPRLKLL